jgi:CDP-diacylglycerol--glycerol-3-phosphate 3-phosphatidyltransferase
LATLALRPPAEFTKQQRRGWYRSVALTLARVALAPALIVAGAHDAPGWLLALIVVLAFASDVFDGVVARRAVAVTTTLRRADSLADTVFYLAVAWVTWRKHGDALLPYRWVIVAVLIGEMLAYVAALVKFRRIASYHARSARLSGIALVLAIVLLLAWHSAVLVPIALVAIVVSQLESIAITLLLRESRTDVPSVLIAWRSRRV